tara:strand:+ start:150 stop:317 length:168 start_codon:yes stop_codon:yes gene_type:complete
MKKYFISIFLSIMIGGSLSIIFKLLGGVNPYIAGAVIGGVCGFFSHYTIYYYNNK